MIWKSSLRIVLGTLLSIWIIGLENTGFQQILELWRLVEPGGKLHPASFLEHRGHIVIETLLLVAIFYLVWIPRSKPKKESSQLTAKDINELCEEWTPDPLVPDTSQEKAIEERVLESRVEKYVKVNGKWILNMQSTDFYGLLTNRGIQKDCEKCIRKLGVGSCGPRAFYGTVDIHLKLEEHIAQFMGSEECIVYAFDVATMPSLLSAFANAKDIIVADECVYFPIQIGCRLSRAQVMTFKHNDMEDLERVLKSIELKHKVEKIPLNRRFIIVEGIYHDYGDVAPLDQIYQLKCKYNYRLVVDESLSFGVLGKTGRGACEEFGLLPGQAEIVTASLSNALVSVGGFCVGDHEIVGHQRLNGHGYIFSASLPPFLAVAADKALSHLERHPEKQQQLRENSKFLRALLVKIPSLHVLGSLDAIDACSPVIHFHILETMPMEEKEARARLELLEDWLWKEREVAICVSQFSQLEWKTPSSTLRIVVTVTHTKKELQRVASSISDAVDCCVRGKSSC